MEDVQGRALCSGSTPGTPITDVFVAVRHRSVTNNNNSKSHCSTGINVSYKNRNSAGRHYPAACISEGR